MSTLLHLPAVAERLGVSLQRAYKDKEGKFQHTTSFKANDIPKAILALSKAYDYLVSEEGAE